MDDLKWAEGVKPKMERIVVTSPVVAKIEDGKVMFNIQAAVVDAANKGITDAVIQTAIVDGVAELYLLDRKFVLDALREKLERERDVDRGW